jgi:hypothetical protein
MRAYACFFKNKICKSPQGDIDVVTKKGRFIEGHYPKPWSIKEIKITVVKRKKK